MFPKKRCKEDSCRVSVELSNDSRDLTSTSHVACDLADHDLNSAPSPSPPLQAINVLEREMAKGGASMLQGKNLGSLSSALSVMVQAIRVFRLLGFVCESSIRGHA